MRYALSLRKQWSHLVFLSEQHLPLQSPSDIASALQNYGSAVCLTRASDMSGGGLADVQNRFAAHYQELPGVGSFGTRLCERPDGFLTQVFHGSNWMALARDHCTTIVAAEAEGGLEPFETAVHSDEMAIQSVIAPLRTASDNIDLTCVAWPHLVDNHDLEMNLSLFRKSLNTNYLFIRKRMPKLDEEVKSHIINNYFNQEIYNTYLTMDHDELSSPRTTSRAFVDGITDSLRHTMNGLSFHDFSRSDVGSGTRLNLAVGLNEDLAMPSVRILSENMRDYKVVLARDQKYDGLFKLPYEKNGTLFSTARVRVYGLFGYEDILPSFLPKRGFVRPESKGEYSDLTEITKELLLYSKTLE